MRPAADIPVLPEGDIDTEAMMIVQDPPVTEQTAAPEEQAVVSPVSEPARTSSEKEMTALSVSGIEVFETEAGTVNEAVTETVAASEASETKIKTAGMAEQKTPAENTVETVISSDNRARADKMSAGEITEPETGTDAEVLASAAAGAMSRVRKPGERQKHLTCRCPLMTAGIM